jgi:hypothetical protein
VDLPTTAVVVRIAGRRFRDIQLGTEELVDDVPGMCRCATDPRTLDAVDPRSATPGVDFLYPSPAESRVPTGAPLSCVSTPPSAAVSTDGMSRRRDFELWREVSRTTVGLTGIVELFAKRVRREDHLDLAREMIKHSDELAARAERQTDEVAAARLEGEARGWREAAVMLRTRRG